MGMWNESDRIAALNRYGVFDSISEADFSDFVQIASDICDTPIAAINLIQSDRHWTLTGIAYGDRELPLNHSICSQAIRQTDLFVVPDLSEDVRFQHNPLVKGAPNLRFYAGAVLQTSDGLSIGTVCVLDHMPRPGGLTTRQRFTLQALARQIMTQLEYRRALLDITQVNAARDKLQASLREKEALLKEVHHRVKNNLQLISSLLNLQASRIADPVTAALFADSRNRVRSMALVHENLYRAGNFAEIEMRTHIESLCVHLRRAYGHPRVELVAESEDVTLDLDRAISCGLIINELVSNAFKHAFPDQRRGHVAVTYGLRDGLCALVVADDGIRISDEIDIVDSMSLGLQLVRDLVEQLEGKLSVDRSSGTRYLLEFKGGLRAGSVS